MTGRQRNGDFHFRLSHLLLEAAGQEGAGCCKGRGWSWRPQQSEDS